MILKKILTEIVDEKSKGRNPQVLFDLDSTLYDITPRNVAILKAAANDSGLKNEFLLECHRLSQVEATHFEWGVEGHLRRLDLHQNFIFKAKIQEYWKQRFFSNEFLHFDTPYAGAVEFVRLLSDAKIDIFYLTGRDSPRMFEGTQKSLLYHGFPYAESMLAMKPNHGVSDEHFKVEYFEQFLKQNPSPYFFENEPVNIELVRKKFSAIKIIYYKSIHCGRTSEPTDLPCIQGWDLQ